MEHTPIKDYGKFPDVKAVDFPSAELAKEAERRWNSHDALVEALWQMLEAAALSEGHQDKEDAMAEAIESTVAVLDNDSMKVIIDRIDKERAALKLAKGE